MTDLIQAGASRARLGEAAAYEVLFDATWVPELVETYGLTPPPVRLTSVTVPGGRVR